MSFEPLKNSLNKKFYQAFFNSWRKLDVNFNQTQMENSIFDEEWDSLELKERTRRLTEKIDAQLPDGFFEATELLIQITEDLAKSGEKIGSYEYFFIPDYIEVFGKNYFNESLNAIKAITQFITCEFAIRPFLVDKPEQVMKYMLVLSKHPHENVRRFSSEGCRPKLPWGMALKSLIKNPSPILPILENLKADKSLFVRKSVANNLNDISKDHPELVIETAKRWQNKNEHTQWIIKHACRTLLKQGNAEAMKLFGYANNKDLLIKPLKLNTPKIKLGEILDFEFSLENKSTSNQLVRIEYGLYFLKASGKRNRKVFKLSERALESGQQILLNKKHTIKEISTRRYYLGEHRLSIIVNGIEVEQTNFILN